MHKTNWFPVSVNIYVISNFSRAEITLNINEYTKVIFSNCQCIYSSAEKFNYKLKELHIYILIFSHVSCEITILSKGCTETNVQVDKSLLLADVI